MRPHHDIATQPADISKIIDLALDYNPMLATADISTPRMWVNAGCDIELDIIHVMENIMSRKKGISSFSYFTNPIMTARDKRKAVEATTQRPQSEKDAVRAKNMRWIIDTGINASAISPADYEWLEQYERKRAEA